MALLDVSNEQLLTIRNALDAATVVAMDHARKTTDPFIAAAIGVTANDYLEVRRLVVEAMKPAPWPIRKQEYDDMQSGDGLVYAVRSEL